MGFSSTSSMTSKRVDDVVPGVAPAGVAGVLEGVRADVLLALDLESSRGGGGASLCLNPAVTWISRPWSDQKNTMFYYYY